MANWLTGIGLGAFAGACFAAYVGATGNLIGACVLAGAWVGGKVLG